MRIFKTKAFDRDARKEKLADSELLKAALRVASGKIDAELGAFLVKQRVSQGPGGRSGGHRAIIVHRLEDRIVFLHLFAKSGKANVTAEEARDFRKAARIIADLKPELVDALVDAREWLEIES